MINQFPTSDSMQIHRKVRPIQSIKHWKATEFRTILLYYSYVGMVAFKSILRDECRFIGN